MLAAVAISTRASSGLFGKVQETRVTCPKENIAWKAKKDNTTKNREMFFIKIGIWIAQI
jgi:hypothetical protein